MPNQEQQSMRQGRFEDDRLEYVLRVFAAAVDISGANKHNASQYKRAAKTALTWLIQSRQWQSWMLDMNDKGQWEHPDWLVSAHAQVRNWQAHYRRSHGKASYFAAPFWRSLPYLLRLCASELHVSHSPLRDLQTVSHEHIIECFQMAFPSQLRKIKVKGWQEKLARISTDCLAHVMYTTNRPLMRYFVALILILRNNKLPLTYIHQLRLRSTKTEDPTKTCDTAHLARPSTSNVCVPLENQMENRMGNQTSPVASRQNHVEQGDINAHPTCVQHEHGHPATHASDSNALEIYIKAPSGDVVQLESVPPECVPIIEARMRKRMRCRLFTSPAVAFIDTDGRQIAVVRLKPQDKHVICAADASICAADGSRHPKPKFDHVYVRLWRNKRPLSQMLYALLRQVSRCERGL